jgi:hypothetical protein
MDVLYFVKIIIHALVAAAAFVCTSNIRFQAVAGPGITNACTNICIACFEKATTGTC